MDLKTYKTATCKTPKTVILSTATPSDGAYSRNDSGSRSTPPGGAYQRNDSGSRYLSF